MSTIATSTQDITEVNMNSSKSDNQFVRFVKNNVALLLIIFCVVAITTVVLVSTLSAGDPDNPTTVIPDPDDETPKTEIVKVYYGSPLSYTSVGMEYTDGKDILFVFNSTLNTWKTHNALDLIAAEGTTVTSMFDGTVTKVEETYGMGNSVTVDHGDGVVATYSSLGSVDVVKGQTLAKGDKIGTVGTTASYEFSDGPHLHLEVYKDNKHVDPMPYVKGEVYIEKEVQVTD